MDAASRLGLAVRGATVHFAVGYIRNAKLVALAACSSWLLSPALASGSFWVSASAYSTASGGADNNASTGDLVGTKGTYVAVGTGGTNPHAGVTAASAHAETHLGKLTAYCDGSTNDYYYEGWLYLSGGRSRFHDILTVTSITLPFGTPVTLHISQAVVPGLSFLGTQFYSRFSSSTGINTANSGPGTTAQRELTPASDTQSDAGPFDFASTVGSVFQFDGDLQVSTQGYWGSESICSCTATYHVDVTTPGADVTSESGRDYSSSASDAGVPMQHQGTIALTAPSPNPTTGATTMTMALPREAHLRVSIEDIAGRTVRMLLDGSAAAGTTVLRWDGADNSGRSMPPGVYRCRMVADGLGAVIRNISLVR